MAQETLREAVRAAYLRGFDSVPSIAVILPDGTPAAHWAGLDAAIAAMLERLRTPSDDMIQAGDTAPKPSEFVWQAMLDKFQQENSND